MRTWLPELAHWVGLLPLVVIVIRGGQSREWTLATAFAVSFVADSVGHFYDPSVVSAAYLVSQGLIASAAFLDKWRDLLYVAVTFVAMGIASVGLYDPILQLPDILLHTVVLLTLFVLAEQEDGMGRARYAVMVYCGAGLVAWWAFAGWLGFDRYALYQLTRVAGIAWFCVACWRPQPALRVA